jgi:hypothetical protein
MSDLKPPPDGGGLFARLADGLRYAVTGRAPAWFGPGAPLAPMVQPPPRGRQFDYPVAYNQRIQPRQDEGVSFAQLRRLADGWDLLRLVIETRKDQIEQLAWTIRPRAGASVAPAVVAEAIGFFRDPDREHGWSGWLRMLLEDLFVLDAAALYVRRDRLDRFHSLEVIDGATLKRVIDDLGRTPVPPAPAYQQILKGVPAIDYTSDEIIYAPRNPRSHRVYGLSPVEQIITTIQIALRRQSSQLAYFTAGNAPDAIIGVPEAWSADQIAEFQRYWDSILTGNDAGRRQTKFVPGGLRYKPTREPPLKDDFDEWLARVVCYAFSVPPTPFIRASNRATAEQVNDTALAEGLGPLMIWLKGLIDRVMADVLGWPDLELVWTDAARLDPPTRCTIETAYVAAGIKTRNEARAALGLDPLPGGDDLTVAGPVQSLAQALGDMDAKAGYDPAEARDPKGMWTTTGDASATARCFMALGCGMDERSNLTAPAALQPIVDFSGGFHDAVVAGWIAYLQSIGCVVVQEPALRIIGPNGSVIGYPDILFRAPDGTLVMIEVKTGIDPPLTANQAAYIPLLQIGGHVYSTDPRMSQLGLTPGEPIPPVVATIVYAKGPGEKYKITLVPEPQFE